METKTFDLTVEKTATNVELKLVRLRWDGDSPPDVIAFGSVILVKVGRYLTTGDHYRYRVASVAQLHNGNLVRETAHG